MKFEIRILGITIFLTLMVFLVLRPKYKPKEFSEHVKGLPNATINVTIYGDFQCLRTRNFWNEILPKLEEDYIKTGKIRLIYKHHPKTFFNYSLEAAEATECAADQGKFWEYVELVFRRTSLICNEVGKGLGLSPNELKNYAKELGLDVKAFSACLDSRAMLPKIYADMRELHEKGLRSSGIVFINNELISGNKPYSEFKLKIEGILKNETTTSPK
ncbi:MAG: thioredoxin domain-containing protein [Candidatus Aenigmatarchaeota archaeon]